jgi:hypothetical protein
MAVRDHFRAHARRRVDLGATLRGRETTDEQPVRVRDLGLGGACIELADAPPGEGGAGWPSSTPRPGGGVEPEAAVTLQVTAPTLWDPLPLRGTISWIRRGGSGKPTRAGVRFEHHDAGALYALYQLLGAQVFEL